MDDFRFPLMRHWTVYDSIIHSRYVAVRLHTWQEKGKDKVKELLVRMGLSQRDCQADYCESSLSHAVQFLSTISTPKAGVGTVCEWRDPYHAQSYHRISPSCGRRQDA